MNISTLRSGVDKLAIGLEKIKANAPTLNFQ